MTFLGNLVWLIFGGLLAGLGYIVGGRDPFRHSILFGQQKIETHVQGALDLGLAMRSNASVDMTIRLK